MITVLQYIVIGVAIGLLIFAIAIMVFGRGEQLAPLPPRTSPTELPDENIEAEDVRKLRFAMSLRGYRMSDVDWALDKLAAELDRRSGAPGPDADIIAVPVPAVPADQATAGHGSADHAQAADQAAAQAADQAAAQAADQATDPHQRSAPTAEPG